MMPSVAHMGQTYLWIYFQLHSHTLAKSPGMDGKKKHSITSALIISQLIIK